MLTVIQLILWLFPIDITKFVIITGLTGVDGKSCVFTLQIICLNDIELRTMACPAHWFLFEVPRGPFATTAKEICSRTRAHCEHMTFKINDRRIGTRMREDDDCPCYSWE